MKERVVWKTHRTAYRKVDNHIYYRPSSSATPPHAEEDRWLQQFLADFPERLPEVNPIVERVRPVDTAELKTALAVSWWGIVPSIWAFSFGFGFGLTVLIITLLVICVLARKIVIAERNK